MFTVDRSLVLDTSQLKDLPQLPNAPPSSCGQRSYAQYLDAYAPDERHPGPDSPDVSPFTRAGVHRQLKWHPVVWLVDHLTRAIQPKTAF